MGELDRNTPGHAELQLGKEHISNYVGKFAIDWASSSWKSRGYLPHYDSLETVQSVTFRLVDSLPKKVLGRLLEKINSLPPEEQEIQKRVNIEKYLDVGYGCCALKNPEMAKVMQETLLKFHNYKYDLIAWCIMPNHVHVLIEAKSSLSKIVQSWKSYTGRWAFQNNERLNLGLQNFNKSELGLGVPRTFWMRDYWDRFIRDEKHFHKTVEYIHQNPVKAGLCKDSKDWLWSSAGILNTTDL